MKAFKAALVQLLVSSDKKQNLLRASEKICEANKSGAKCVALPECFNSLYGLCNVMAYFNENAEIIPNGETSKTLSALAKSYEMYIIGGTIPERVNNKLYNTCTVWNPSGDLIARYRKMHLFDIDIPNKITFKESEVLSAGDDISIFKMFGWTVGLGICYDLRFDEFAKLYRQRDCNLLIYPAAFNLTTGPPHFELLQRARAIDNQSWVFTISPARAPSGYQAWGHSQITDPWGTVCVQAEENEEIIYHDISPDICNDVRRNIPIYKQRRTDIYDTIKRVK